MANTPTTIADFVGRTIDLVAYYGVSPNGERLLEETLAPSGESGAITTGVQKVVQRFLIELLKERGSMTFRPNEGTLFITEARRGRFRTPAEVEGAFARGVSDVRITLQNAELDTDPDDERFVSAEITGVVVVPNTAIIRFIIQTRAGVDRKFIFPLTVPL